MKAFATLIEQLSTTTKTAEKVEALYQYFKVANDRDKVWAIALFTGRRPRRTISSTLLKTWCADYCNLPLWLLEECRHTVGDLSETIALLIPVQSDIIYTSSPLHVYIEKLISLSSANEAEKKAYMLQCWQQLNSSTERFVFNKLMSGAFRIGVSQQLLIQALSKFAQMEASFIAHCITGKWDPSLISFHELINVSAPSADVSKPYPFCLAYPIESGLDKLGDSANWLAEWKWDGIRGQLIKRKDTAFLWSRGEELITEKFPELNQLFTYLPNGIVLDGEIVAAIHDKPLPFSLLQTRIGRKHISKKILSDAPVRFFAYDILEYRGEDIRQYSLENRRKILESLVTSLNVHTLFISPSISFTHWQELKQIHLQSRANSAEGFMLKKKKSPYYMGRKKGDWWKWKVDPYTIDAVLIYAQKGSGRRGNLYTDFTFAVKDGDKLVPFAKAYSGLTNAEIAQVDAFVKRNAVEKFGPVRTVKPELVFELAFEGIHLSSRHKCGIAVRFPRIYRWRKDKKPEEINTLADLKALL